MKLVRTTPCKECPFRKGAPPGWLGAWPSAEEILQQAESEMGLPCHMQVLKNIKSGDDLVNKHVCVGSLHMANNSFKLYRPGNKLREQAEKVGKSEECMTRWDFKDWHEGQAFTPKKRKP